MDQIRMISADSHVTIPKDLLFAQLPPTLREKVAAAEAAFAAQNLRAKPQKAKQEEIAAQRAPRGLPNMGAGVPGRPQAERAGMTRSNA